MGYEGGMVKAICPFGNAKAVIVTQAYMAPDAPNEGIIDEAAAFLVALAAELDTAETAACHVSTGLAALAGEDRRDMRRGYLNFTVTVCETRDAKMPAER